MHTQPHTHTLGKREREIESETHTCLPLCLALGCLLADRLGLAGVGLLKRRATKCNANNKNNNNKGVRMSNNCRDKSKTASCARVVRASITRATSDLQPTSPPASQSPQLAINVAFSHQVGTNAGNWLAESACVRLCVNNICCSCCCCCLHVHKYIGIHIYTYLPSCLYSPQFCFRCISMSGTGKWAAKTAKATTTLMEFVCNVAKRN